MKIRQVTALYYSATGTTRTVVCRAAEAAARVLNVPWREVSFTTQGERAAELNFTDGDLVVCGSPTYAGRLPNKLAPDFRAKWQGNGAAAVAVVTFGNRAFDNSLAELTDLLKQNGFRVLGAGAFVCRHAFTDALAADRPNSDDLALAEELGAAAAEKAGSDAPGADVSVPGNPEAPYYIPRGVDGAPAKFLPAKAQVKRELCTGCGRCAAICPMGSIDAGSGYVTAGICIKCQACIRSCPEQARFFDDPAFLSHVRMLEQNMAEPKRSTIYLK